MLSYHFHCCRCGAIMLRCFLETFRRVPSMSSISSASGSSMTVLPTAVDGAPGKDFDAISIESYGLSPLALQNIREQMALGLERTKELEERIKIIPTLQVSSLPMLSSVIWRACVKIHTDLLNIMVQRGSYFQFTPKINVFLEYQSLKHIGNVEGRHRTYTNIISLSPVIIMLSI